MAIRFATAAVSQSRTAVLAAAQSASRGPLLHSYRRYKSTKSHPDFDKDKLIKDEVVNERLQKLEQDGLTANQSYTQRRIVFNNLHLYQRDRRTRLGKANHKRMAKGNAPHCDDGKPLNLHHIDQTQDGPWAVVTEDYHKSNHQDLHTNAQNAQAVKRNKFKTQRNNYWKSMARK